MGNTYFETNEMFKFGDQPIVETHCFYLCWNCKKLQQMALLYSKKPDLRSTLSGNV